MIFLQQKLNPIYAVLTFNKRNNRPKPPAPEDNVVVYSKLMNEEQADVIRQQLEQKPPSYDDVEIGSTSVHASVTVIPPGIHGDRDVTSFKVEDNQNDIPPSVPARVLSQNSPQRTPPIPPTTTLPPPSPPPLPPPPSHLSSSSQVSHSGNIPDTIQSSRDEIVKGSTQKDIHKPEPGQLPGNTSSKLEILCLLP